MSFSRRALCGRWCLTKCSFSSPFGRPASSDWFTQGCKCLESGFPLRWLWKAQLPVKTPEVSAAVASQFSPTVFSVLLLSPLSRSCSPDHSSINLQISNLYHKIGFQGTCKPLPVRINSIHLLRCGQLCPLSFLSCHVTFMIQERICSLESHLIEKFLAWCTWAVDIHTNHIQLQIFSTKENFKNCLQLPYYIERFFSTMDDCAQMYRIWEKWYAHILKNVNLCLHQQAAVSLNNSMAKTNAVGKLNYWWYPERDYQLWIVILFPAMFFFSLTVLSIITTCLPHV